MFRSFLRRLGFVGVDRFFYPRPIGMEMWGEVTCILRGPDGAVKTTRHARNKIVTVGLYHVADQMADQGEDPMSHMAIGFGTTSATAGDTTLESEQDRNALTSTTQGSDTDAHKVTFVGDFVAGEATGAVTEMGILNAASAGTLLNRQVFSAINKGADDSLQITVVLTFSEAT